MKKVVYKYRIFFYLITFLIITISLFQFQFLRDIVKLIFISFIIAYALKPIHQKMQERGINNRLAAVFIIIFFIMITIIFFTVLIPNVIKESSNINTTFNDIEEYFYNIRKNTKYLSDNEIINNIFVKLYESGNKSLEHLIEGIFNSIIDIGENLLSLIVIPIMVYYFLADRVLINNRIMISLPTKNRKIINKILSDVDKILTRYIISQFILCFLIGILTFIVLKTIGVRYTLILSIINGFFNIIPYFGPILGSIPAVLVALIQSPKSGIITIIGLYIVQIIEGNIISPKVIGETVSMHPLMVILLLTIGGNIGGFIGMILAVPVGVIIKVLYEDINYYLF